MSVLIDLTSGITTEVVKAFESIQKRYLDPYNIILTTKTDKYRFVESEINNMVSKLYGNNTVLEGLKIKNIDAKFDDNYVNVEISKGSAIVDKTLIEFTDDIILKVPLHSIDIDNIEHNIVGIEYNHVQKYPPNTAIIIVTKYAEKLPFNIKVVTAAFKLDKNNPDNPVSEIKNTGLSFKINGTEIVVKPPVGKLTEVLDNASKEIGKIVEEGSAIVISKPEITSPTDGQVDFTGPIQSSPYIPSENFYGPHDASDWEIASDPEFKNIVESSYNDKTNLTSYHPQHLNPKTTYYVRVRYRSDYHISRWSEPVSFTTADAYIETPTVSTSDSGTLYPTFKLTPFKTYGYTDNWQSTDWQIATDSKFNNLILNYTETDPSKQDTLTINSDILDVDSTYYVRARYNGDKGHSSDWSNVLEYNTAKYQIEYTIPSQENELSTVEDDVTHDSDRTFDTSKYTLNGTVTHGTLTISGMHFAWQLPEVDKDTEATITLWVTRNSDSKIVTDKSSKQLTIKDVSLVSDSAVSVSNFKDNTEHNDGWDLDA